MNLSIQPTYNSTRYISLPSPATSLVALENCFTRLTPTFNFVLEFKALCNNYSIFSYFKVTKTLLNYHITPLKENKLNINQLLNNNYTSK